jgi:hypothetical protein
VILRGEQERVAPRRREEHVIHRGGKVKPRGGEQMWYLGEEKNM